MPIDATIPLSYKQTDPMASLSSMLDVGAKSLSLQKSRQTFDADVARAKAESSTQQSAASVNSASIQARINQIGAESSTAQSGATVNAANVNPLIQQQAARTSEAQTGAQSAQFKLHGDYMNTALQTANGLINDPRIANLNPATYNPEHAIEAILEAKKQMISKGVPETQAEISVAPFINGVHKPGVVQQMLKNTLTGQLGAGGQATAINPNAMQTDDGQRINTNNINQLGPNGIGASVINPIQKQLPPTTPMTSASGQAGYVGPNSSQQRGTGNPYLDHGGVTQISQAEGDVNALKRQLSARNLTNDQRQILGDELVKAEKVYQQESSKPTPGFVASGMLPGQGESIASTQKGINDHFANLQARASTAAQDIAILQNIKLHAKGASTGIGSDRLAIQQAILGKLGIDSAKASTMDYEMLGKNAAMIQLAGGDTNLAKTLAGFANPSSHMSEPGINQAVQQLIGPKKMDLAAIKLFQPFKLLSDKGHPAAYNDMIPKFAAANDSRIMQLSDMTDEEKKKMKQGMTPAQSKRFKESIDELESMGIRP